MTVAFVGAIDVCVRPSAERGDAWVVGNGDITGVNASSRAQIELDSGLQNTRTPSVPHEDVGIEVRRTIGASP